MKNKMTVDDKYSLVIYLMVIFSAVLLILVDNSIAKIHPDLHILYPILLIFLTVCALSCLISLIIKHRRFERICLCFLIPAKIIIFLEKTILYGFYGLQLFSLTYINHIFLSIYMIAFAIFRLFKIKNMLQIDAELSDIFAEYGKYSNQ